MMKTRLLEFGMLSLCSIACGGSLYTVGNKEAGIPFYAAEQYTVVADVYKEELHEISVTRQVVTDDRKTVLHEVSETIYTADAACTTALIDAFARGTTSESSYQEWKRAGADPLCSKKLSLTPPNQKTWAEIGSAAQKKDSSWIARRTEQRTRLSAKPSYINIDKAAIGTTSGTIKLNDKGQLTEATASNENKTADAVINAVGKAAELASGQLPFKELLLDKWGLQPAEKPGAEKALGPLTKLENVIARLKYVYRPRLYTIECENAQPCEPPLSFAMSESQSSTTKASTDDDSIEFSGAVKLPKSKPEK